MEFYTYIFRKTLVYINFLKRRKMKDFDEFIAEAVRQYSCLYDRADEFFNHREYVASCWENVATDTNLPDGKFEIEA